MFFVVRGAEETLFRGWRGRVKGRDWYDVVWYIGKNIPLDLSLFSKIAGKDYTADEFKELLSTKIDDFDLNSAIEDAVAFARDPEIIRRTWTKDYFRNWVAQLTLQ